MDLAECLRKADTLLEVIYLALSLRPIEAFMTYDKRQAAAARRVGLPTVSPGMAK